MSSEAFCNELLKETHVAIVPGTAFGSCGERSLPEYLTHILLSISKPRLREFQGL